jgi:riboflavin kinase/FMN adenylyltransferase
MPAAVSVGDNPTFVSSRRVEAYVLDADFDIYGVPVEIGFTKHLRGMVAFASVEDLVAQMRRDVEDTRALAR